MGADYSRWRDVALTLSCQYGARATREVYSDESTSAMYVAAPVKAGDKVLGVLTVAKPMSTVGKLEEATRRLRTHVSEFQVFWAATQSVTPNFGF